MPASERTAFVEGWLWICASRIGLTTLGLRRMVRRWHRPARGSAAWPAAARWLPVASRYCPGGDNCLVRSLALFGALRRSGVAAELRIGIGQIAPQLEAHAWVEVDGAPVNDRADVARRYAPFAALLESPGGP